MLLNIFFILLYAVYLESRVSSGAIIFCYILSGTFSSFIFVKYFQAPLGVSIGASANVYGIIGFFWVVFNRCQNLNCNNENQFRWVNSIVINLFTAYLFLAEIYDVIDNFYPVPPSAIAHIVGFLIGISFGTMIVCGNLKKTSTPTI